MCVAPKSREDKRASRRKVKRGKGRGWWKRGKEGRKARLRVGTFTLGIFYFLFYFFPKPGMCVLLCNFSLNH
jgi:hypothetical protein